MKRCDYCGKQYADLVSVCPADGHPTVNPQAQPEFRSNSTLGPVAFNTKVVSPRSAAGSYRVFLQGGDLVFSWAASPPIGWLFSRRKARDFQQRLQSDAPENLLRDSEKNFRLNFAEIRAAAIEPATFWSFGDDEAGRLALAIRHGETLTRRSRNQIIVEADSI